MIIIPIVITVRIDHLWGHNDPVCESCSASSIWHLPLQIGAELFIL